MLSLSLGDDEDDDDDEKCKNCNLDHLDSSPRPPRSQSTKPLQLPFFPLSPPPFLRQLTLSTMAQPPPHAILYHLAPIPRWKAAIEGSEEAEYKPETFEKDGHFVHLSSDASFLLPVGNSFYKQSKDDWVLLELDVSKLKGEVRYEAAAPVGETQPSEELTKKRGQGKEGEGEGGETLFPHLYGSGISNSAVVRERKVTRGEDGSFLSIEGMC